MHHFVLSELGIVNIQFAVEVVAGLELEHADCAVTREVA